MRVGPVRSLESVQIARGSLARGAVQKRSEFAPFLATVLKRRPKTVVEIGRAAGGSLWALCRAAASDATIVSVDLPNGPFGGTEASADDVSRLDGYAQPRQSLYLIEANSHDPETVSRVRDLAPRIDLLFIDGDHSYEGVRADFEAYAPLVPEGGLVALHDIAPGPTEAVGGVPRFWQELCAKDVKSVEIIADSGCQLGYGIGLIAKHGS